MSTPEGRFAAIKKVWQSPALQGFTFIVIMTTVIAIFFRLFVFGLFAVPSESMKPTLLPGDRIIASKSILDFFKPGPRFDRGDVIVFEDDLGWLDGKEGYLVKRIIGIPGDHVEGKEDGSVWVNGKKINEPYLEPTDDPTTELVFDVKVPQDRLWVMGDNRDNSADSRWHRSEDQDGTISTDSVEGRVAAIGFPLNRLEVFE